MQVIPPERKYHFLVLWIIKSKQRREREKKIIVFFSLTLSFSPVIFFLTWREKQKRQNRGVFFLWEEGEKNTYNLGGKILPYALIVLQQVITVENMVIKMHTINKADPMYFSMKNDEVR